MSDRSPLTITIDPSAPVTTIAAALARLDDEVGIAADVSDVQAGQSIVVDDISLGTYDDIHTSFLTLIEDGWEGPEDDDDHDADTPIIVADFAFTIQQDPVYDYDGYLVKHTPGIAEDFGADCTSTGQVILSNDVVLGFIDAAESLDALKATVRTALGLDHKL